MKRPRVKSGKKRNNWAESVSANDPRMVGLSISWVDHDISSASAIVSGYKLAHRKSLYSQFCSLLANECASSGNQRNPRQWAFELAIQTKCGTHFTPVQFSVYSTFYEAMAVSVCLVENTLIEHGFDKDAEVIVAYYSECVSLKEVADGLDRSILNSDDSEREELSLTFHYESE